MRQTMDNSKQNTSSRPAQAVPFDLAILQLFLRYFRVLTRPSVKTLGEESDSARWDMVLVQFLALIMITVGLNALGHKIPTAALHATAALSIGSFSPFTLLPPPYSGLTFVLTSFFIGLGTAYLFSRLSGGRGTFLSHTYTLLLCTVPLVTISGTLLLIPATGSLVLWLIGLVAALFIYRMVLHTLTIMAVHDLSVERATFIVLIIPMIIVALALLFLAEGLGEIFVVLLETGKKRKKASMNTK